MNSISRFDGMRECWNTSFTNLAGIQKGINCGTSNDWSGGKTYDDEFGDDTWWDEEWGDLDFDLYFLHLDWDTRTWNNYPRDSELLIRRVSSCSGSSLKGWTGATGKLIEENWHLFGSAPLGRGLDQWGASQRSTDEMYKMLALRWRRGNPNGANKCSWGQRVLLLFSWGWLDLQKNSNIGYVSAKVSWSLLLV